MLNLCRKNSDLGTLAEMIISLLLVSTVLVLRGEASSAEAGQKLHYSYSKERWLPVEVS